MSCEMEWTLYTVLVVCYAHMYCTKYGMTIWTVLCSWYGYMTRTAYELEGIRRDQ